MEKRRLSKNRPASSSPRYRIVFWDWNGTLLDDRDYAISVRNRVFPRFGLPEINSLEEYFDQFTFPVRKYYDRAGVTDDNFAEVANAWMDEYVRGCSGIRLRKDAIDALRVLQNAGFRQVMLSASDKKIMKAQLAQYRLADYFSAVLGLDHIYATGKLAIGQAYLRECGVPPAECVLFGDMPYDADVARQLGMDCILVAGGHQSEAALIKAGAPVYNTLLEAVNSVARPPEL